MGYIYIIKNTVNDKVYIGKTIQTLERRFQKHLSDSKKLDTHFARAIRKYGSDKFYIEQIEECPVAQMNERERY